MSNVIKQVADIEKELLNLSGNQPPNPNQMQIYTVSGVSSTDPQAYTIVFDDGIIRLTKAFAEPGGYAVIKSDLGFLQVYVAGTPPIDFSVVSLGAFSLV